MTEYIKNPLSGRLRGVTYEDGKIIDVHIRDTDDVVKVFVPARQEWISVTERLPEEKVNCIVHYKYAYCDNDDYWAIGMCFYDGEKFQFDPAYKVTHWMPMPEPPKGD